MNKLRYILLLLSAQLTFAQHADGVDRITFHYLTGGTRSIRKEGLHHKSEIIELRKSQNKDYHFSKHIKITEKIVNREFVIDTVTMPIANYPTVAAADITALLAELNETKDNYTEDFIKKKITKPTKKQISAIAGIGEKKVSDTSKIINLQHFKDFIEASKPALSITMHAYNTLSISTEPSTNDKNYQMDFIASIGQPIMILTSPMERKLEQTVNLNVNLLIQKIVPKDSETYKVVDIDQILEFYIFWFLKNKIP